MEWVDYEAKKYDRENGDRPVLDSSGLDGDNPYTCVGWRPPQRCTGFHYATRTLHQCWVQVAQGLRTCFSSTLFKGWVGWRTDE